MGTLTGIAVRLMDHPGGRLQVVNVNERNRTLLSNLGLDHVFEVDQDGSAWREEREMVKARSPKRWPTAPPAGASTSAGNASSKPTKTCAKRTRRIVRNSATCWNA